MKISIIGLGNVGSTLAYTIALRGLTDELVLVNRTHSKAQADALDLQQSIPFTSHTMSITAGHMPDIEGSHIVCLAASCPLRPEYKTRADLGREIEKLMREVVPQIAEHCPNAILIVLTNPVDPMTYLAWKISGLAKSKVIGTGTFIDSLRYRHALSQEVGIHPADLRTYIIGEHGDTQFPLISTATAGGEAMEDTPEKRQLFKETVDAANQIVAHKGYTNFAISTATACIIESIVKDAKHTIPVSCYIDGFCGESDVFLSLPAVIGREGINKVFHPQVNNEEQANFKRSSAVVKKMIADFT